LACGDIDRSRTLRHTIADVTAPRGKVGPNFPLDKGLVSGVFEPQTRRDFFLAILPLGSKVV
jgi:hypothetical protein